MIPFSFIIIRLIQIMTEILSIMSKPNKLGDKNISQLQTLKKILLRHQIFNFTFENCVLTFLVKLRTQADQNSSINLNSSFRLFVSMSIGTTDLSISFTPLDENNLPIKAKGCYQRTSLIRLGLSLNDQLEFFCLKLNPLTGQFCLSRDFLITGDRYPQFLEDSLKAIEKEFSCLTSILQLFQLCPKPENKFIARVQAIVDDQCYGIRHLQQNAIQEEASQNFQQHCRYFFAGSTKIEQLKPSLMQSLYRVEEKDKIIGRVLKQTAFIGRTNLLYINSKNQLDLEKIKANMDPGIKDAEGGSVSVFEGGQKVELKYELESVENVSKEYRSCQRVFRKCYLTFLKQYVQLQAQPACKHFVFYLYEEYVPLKFFLSHNLSILSFYSRVKISLNIAAIVLACKSAFKNFNLNLSIDNLIICQNHCIKVNQLRMQSYEMEKQAAGTIYRLFYKTHPGILQRSKNQKNKHFVQFSQKCQLYGPSPFILPLSKVLSDILCDHLAEHYEGSDFECLVGLLQNMRKFYDSGEDTSMSRSPTDSFLF